jgi:UDP-N-acetylglucosamine--N-acetylmuramyl-(pentapeptide) pyrophosphoryl-undecaprenol N-acetylglucosamine transferase
MKILVVGGGSGGHVTPVVAVIREIKRIHPRAKIRFWCDRKFAAQARAIIGHFDKPIPFHTIFAGKLRRYHHMTVTQQLMWPSLVWLNIRDAFLVGIGFLQSVVKLVLWRPDVIFTKGGYVCLPVGIAARLLHIPIVIHDSDAYPGLTNRILSKWAVAIATGAPLEYYSYPIAKTRYVGIPIAPEFHEFTNAERQEAKKQWGVNPNKPLIVVTGGGLGAIRINNAVILSLNKLLKLGSLILVSGAGQYDELRSIVPPNSDSFQLHPFISKDIASLFGAADVVVTRAGATTILELATSVRPTILIPNAKLTGGHQLKNAAVYAEKGACLTIDEDAMVDNPQVLVSAIHDVLSDPKNANEMAQRLALFACPNAASDMAEMILEGRKS